MSKVTEVRLVCELLNGIDSTEYRQHPLYSKSKEIARYIENHFGKVEKATDTEDDFSSLGDMTIFVKGKEFILELKKIESSNKGKGTLANSSQNIFSELNLINCALGWSTWRQQHGYRVKILKLLGIDSANEKGLESEARKLRDMAHVIADKFGLKKGSMASLIIKIKNDHLSQLNAKDKLTIDKIDQILKTAREDLNGYLNDCRKKGINTDNLGRAISLLKLGYHTLPLLKEAMTKNIHEIMKKSNYSIIYYYPKQKDSENKFKIESPEEIKKWIKEGGPISAEIEGESLWVKRGSVKRLQFKFHWRNVFFGIATPSVEVFDRTNL